MTHALGSYAAPRCGATRGVEGLDQDNRAQGRRALARSRQDGESESRSIRGRATSLDAQVQRSSTLQVRTDDGDTISISISSLQRLQRESVRAQGGGARLQYQGESASSDVSVEIVVDGTLDADEAEDIGDLLAQLTGAAAASSGEGGDAPGQSAETADNDPFDSLDSFVYAYQEQVSVEYSSARQRSYVA